MPKVKKTNKAVPGIQPVDGLSAVDQELARLRTHNEQFLDILKQSEEGRADAFLYRTLHEKLAVIIELKDKLCELSKVRDQEKEENRKQIVSLDAKYKAMHEQLTSEIQQQKQQLDQTCQYQQQRHTNIELNAYKEKTKQYEIETKSLKKNYQRLRQKLRMFESYIRSVNDEQQSEDEEDRIV